LCWLIEAGHAPSALRFAETARNEPMQHFLRADGFTLIPPEHVAVDSVKFHGTHGDALDLFTISTAVPTDDRVTGVR
jgi:hypothetical protein